MTRLSGAPTVLVMDTVKGRGAHYAGLLESHYLPLTQNQYDQATAQLANETP